MNDLGLLFSIVAIAVVFGGWIAYDHFRDTPRFCPDCGEAIEVATTRSFDPKTGVARNQWYWHCPRVYVEVRANGGTYASQTGNHIHVWGVGRPRWHQKEITDGS